jgi:hypothetical protein
MKRISEERYHEVADSYEGFCTSCQDFTRECTEPDAEDYDCPVCEENSVVGVELALMMGLIDIG